MKNAAIIGITGYGAVHYELLLNQFALGRLRPAAAVVINPEHVPERVAALREYGCRIYGSVDDMWAVERDIDLTMIPTSIATHAPFVHAALDRGSHVFVEKPLTGTIEDALGICERAERLDRMVAVGFQDLYCPQNHWIKRRILDGDFGRIRRIKVFGVWPRTAQYFGRNDWAGRLRNASGWVFDSPVQNAMAHFLSLILYWAGASEHAMATPVAIEGDLYRARPIESFDTVAMRVQTSEGPELMFWGTHSGERAIQPIIRVEGDAGWLEWDFAWRVRLQDRAGRECTLPQVSQGRVRETMMDAIVRRLETGEGRVVTARMAAAHTLCVNGLMESASIHSIDPEFVDSVPSETSEIACIGGIRESIRQVFAENKLFREAGLPWARGKGEPFDLHDYASFKGRHLQNLPAPSTVAQ